MHNLRWKKKQKNKQKENNTYLFFLNKGQKEEQTFFFCSVFKKTAKNGFKTESPEKNKTKKIEQPN